MLRAVNQQQIFLDAEDYQRFLSILVECKEVCGFALYAYCLMGNHIHLLIGVNKEPLETIFRRIGSRFVYWYNLKYERAGHLFQDRYRSEPVEDDSYFLTVLRYILRNPINAGMEHTLGTYRWSSYHAYLGDGEHFTDIDLALSIAGSREDLLRFLQEENKDRAMDVTSTCRTGLTDTAAVAMAQKITGCNHPSAFQDLPRQKREAMIRELYHRRLSLRQIARLTGTSKTTVETIVKKNV